MTTLHFQQLHSGGAAPGGPLPRVLVCVHSLATSSSFLAPLAQRAIDSAASASGVPWTAVLGDQRGHGGSKGLPGLGPPHSVDSMADDLARTLCKGQQDGRWGPPDAFVGHSIGGLVALELAGRLAAAAAAGGPPELTALGVPKQVWTVDARLLPIGPDHPSRGEIGAFFGALCAVPEPMESVKAMEDAMTRFWTEAGAPAAPAWALAMCSHLVKPDPSGGGGYVRQFDAAVLPETMESFCEKDYSALLANPPPGCTLHVVRGLASSLWEDDGQQELAFIQKQVSAGKCVRLHEVDGATHWIPISHEDELAALLAAIGEPAAAIASRYMPVNSSS